MIGASHHALALALGALSVLALIPTAVALHRAHLLGDWDSTATLVFAVGVLGSLPTVLFDLISGRVTKVDTFGNAVVGLSGWAYRVDQLATVLLIGGGMAFFLHRCSQRDVRVNVAALVAILVWLDVGLSDGLNGHGMFAPRQLALLAVLLAAVVARPGRSALLGAAAVGLLLALLGGFQAVLHADSVFRTCRADKCGLLGTLYTGIFTNENTYGLALALSVSFIWMAFRGPVRIILACYVAGIAYVTGSRSAELVAVVSVVILFILRPSISDDPEAATRFSDDTPVGKPALAVLAACSAAFIGFVLPFLNLDPNSLTQRPYFWKLARTQLSASPLYGLGSEAWASLYQAGMIPVALTYSVHNQWLDVIYTGGMIGLLFFVLLLVSMLLRAGRAHVVVASCLLIPVLAGSSLERPWSFDISDWLTFTLLATILMPARTIPASTTRRAIPQFAGRPEP